MKTFEQARRENPRMRRTRPVGIIASTSRRYVVQCCLCGEKESCCKAYPVTQRVKKFKAYHNAGKCQSN